MKKMLALLMSMTLVVGSLSGCGGSSENSAPQTTAAAETTTAAAAEEASVGEVAEGETYDVAVILRISDMYAAWMKEAFEAAAKEAGYANLNVTVMDNQDNDAKHIELVENCIEQQYDYIVWQGRQGNQEDLYKKALDAGIGVITLNYCEEWMEQYFPAVMCDDYKLGYMIAERAAEEIPEGGRVCILNGPAGNVVTESRRQGFFDALINARDDIEFLDEQNADFKPDMAMTKTEDWLQAYGGDIDAIVAASDSMAVGAINAFNASGFDPHDCLFYGIDGLTDACMAILDGTMSCSALQDATMYSTMCLDLVEQDIDGEIDICGGKFEPVVYFDPVIIDSSNAQTQFDFYKSQGMVQ